MLKESKSGIIFPHVHLVSAGVEVQLHQEVKIAQGRVHLIGELSVVLGVKGVTCGRPVGKLHRGVAF